MVDKLNQNEKRFNFFWILTREITTAICCPEITLEESRELLDLIFESNLDIDDYVKNGKYFWLYKDYFLTRKINFRLNNKIKNILEKHINIKTIID